MTILGLLPLMLSEGTGADVAKRIASPMQGGLFTLTLMTLFVIPAAYVVWRSRQMEHTWNDRSRTVQQSAANPHR